MSERRVRENQVNSTLLQRCGHLTGNETREALMPRKLAVLVLRRGRDLFGNMLLRREVEENLLQEIPRETFLGRRRGQAGEEDVGGLFPQALLILAHVESSRKALL